MIQKQEQEMGDREKCIEAQFDDQIRETNKSISLVQKQKLIIHDKLSSVAEDYNEVKRIKIFYYY